MFLEYKRRYDIWLSSLTSKDIIQENKRRRLIFENNLTSGKGKKKLRLIKDPNFPTPPKTPYIYFAMERMGEEGSGGLKKLEELIFEWKKLTPDDRKVMEIIFSWLCKLFDLLLNYFIFKKPYIKKYNEDNLRYEERMEEYRKMESSLT